VLTNVTHDMRIMREETFGPVLPIMSIPGDEEAVRLANDSPYGLAASIWSRDRARAERLALHLEAGTVMINDAVSCFGISEAPHGGVKDSGIGRTHGRLGLEEVVRIKYLDSDRLPRMKKVWWFGYGGEFSRQMEGFVDSLFSSGPIQRLQGAIRSLGALRRKSQL
jgi:succinate-semialdehyde dehydrogenase/glutarate-semialdehyde dehydrogenase